MERRGPFDGTLRYVYAHWPRYAAGYGGGALLLLALMIAAVQRGWWGFVLPAFAALFVLAYFFGASLWAAYQQYDVPGQRDHELLFTLGQIQPTDRFVHVGLGTRVTARALSRRLTSGRVTVIDVYNPALTPGQTLVRLRRLAGFPRPDPRLTFLDGSIDLLPVPDNSVSIVTMNRCLSEFWQRGDRLCLLQEARRILVPGGRLLLAERARSETNALVLGPVVLRLPRPEEWRQLLEEAGFQIVKEVDVRGLVHCWRADNPLPGAVQQLTFDFGL